jgi:hypothetical protein
MAIWQQFDGRRADSAQTTFHRGDRDRKLQTHAVRRPAAAHTLPESIE